MSCSLGQTFEMGVLQLEKVAFERVTESKQICIICKTQGRNTRRGGVDSFMQFRDVKQEKNRGERRALRNTTIFIFIFLFFFLFDSYTESSFSAMQIF